MIKLVQSFYLLAVGISTCLAVNPFGTPSGERDPNESEVRARYNAIEEGMLGRIIDLCTICLAAGSTNDAGVNHAREDSSLDPNMAQYSELITSKMVSLLEQ